MERGVRAKKVSKAAGALASLQAIKAGEAKAMDAFELEDEDALEAMSDGAASDGYVSEGRQQQDQCPKKRKLEAGACLAPKCRKLGKTIYGNPRTMQSKSKRRRNGLRILQRCRQCLTMRQVRTSNIADQHAIHQLHSSPQVRTSSIEGTCVHACS
jgi:hypothetical protein